MSVDVVEFINRIPGDKLIEIVNSFTASTTGQQMLESLSALGIEASEEEAEALVASLFLKDGEGQVLSDEDLSKVAAGEEDHSGWNWRKVRAGDGSEIWVWFACPNCHM